MSGPWCLCHGTRPKIPGLLCCQETYDAVLVSIKEIEEGKVVDAGRGIRFSRSAFRDLYELLPPSSDRS